MMLIYFHEKYVLHKLILLLVMFGFATGGFAQAKLPSVVVSDIKGEKVESRSILKDSIPVVVSFWSTICKPCIEELNAFTDQWENWQKEINFRFVAVSTDDVRTVAKVPSFVAGHEWPFTIWLDRNQDFKRAFNVNAIPHLYVLAPDGTVAYARIGYTPGSEWKVLEVLKELK